MRRRRQHFSVAQVFIDNLTGTAYHFYMSELTPMSAMAAGTIVKYAIPGVDESALRFVVVEWRGDRVLIASLDFPDWRIAPTEVVAVHEVCPA